MREVTFFNMANVDDTDKGLTLEEQIQIDFNKLQSRVLGTQVDSSPMLSEFTAEELDFLVAICPAKSEAEKTLSNLSQTLILKMPKTDLHVHGEAGFLQSITLAEKIATRNGVTFPEELVDRENKRWLYRGKEDFMQFIRDFLTISELIRTPLDIEEIAYAFYQDCYENNVVFSLFGISWVQCKAFMTWDEFNQAYNRAILRGMNDFGPVTLVRLRYYQERHITPDDFATIRNNLYQNPNPLTLVIGLAGAEEGFPFEEFRQYFEEDKVKRKESLNRWHFLTSHVEEGVPSTQVADIASSLDWVGHGRRIADSEDNLRKMASLKTRFEICPVSDVTCFPDQLPRVADHVQLKKLIESGLATLNSDDPAFFGNIAAVYQSVYDELKVSFSQLLQCSLNGVCSASSDALQEMARYQKDDYANYLIMVNLGIMKIQFYQYFWQLLPLLRNLENKVLQQDLFNIDLKTTLTELNALMERVPPNQPMLLNQVKALRILKITLNNLFVDHKLQVVELEKSFSEAVQPAEVSSICPKS